MPTPTLFFAIGLPYSDKQEWAEEKSKHGAWIIDIELISSIFQNPETVQNITDIVASDAVYSNKDIIVLEIEADSQTVQQWESFANENHIDFKVKTFTDITLGDCLRINAEHGYPYSHQYIEKLHATILNNWVKHAYHKNSQLPDAYIVDVDGTVAKMHNRNPYDWHKVGNDRPVTDVIKVVQRLSRHANIIILSGRSSVCREQTIEWLNKHHVSFNEIHMRGENDRRDDRIVKRELFNRHIRTKYNVLGAFDDRDRVVDLWRDMGVTCFQVNYGDF